MSFIYCHLNFNANLLRPWPFPLMITIYQEILYTIYYIQYTYLLNRTRFPYLDFYRAQSSVNLPLSDLLPAVDRMNNKSGKTKLNVYEHVSSITSVLYKNLSTEIESCLTTQFEPIVDYVLPLYFERSVLKQVFVSLE
jgi:hypothetical protein